MSFLKELQKKKEQLKTIDTVVTYADGKKYIENGGEIIKQLEHDQKSYGFVIDTKPDTIPACILENQLYLGSQDSVDGNNIEKYSITHILSVGIDTPKLDCNRNVFCKFLPCLDLPETNIYEIIQNANLFIYDAIENCHGTVLVHCNAGVSRSTALIIGYLMLHKNYTFEDAFKLVKMKRECIQPNVGFMRQLKNIKIS